MTFFLKGWAAQGGMWEEKNRSNYSDCPQNAPLKLYICFKLKTFFCIDYQLLIFAVRRDSPPIFWTYCHISRYYLSFEHDNYCHNGCSLLGTLQCWGRMFLKWLTKLFRATCDLWFHICSRELSSSAFEFWKAPFFCSSKFDDCKLHRANCRSILEHCVTTFQSPYQTNTWFYCNMLLIYGCCRYGEMVPFIHRLYNCNAIYNYM